MLTDATMLRRCELCDIPIEYAIGERRLVFAGHGPELEAALKAKDELWQHAAATYARQVDEHLVKHGLPTRMRLARPAPLERATMACWPHTFESEAVAPLLPETPTFFPGARRPGYKTAPPVPRWARKKGRA